MLTKEQREKVQGSGKEKDKWKGYWKRRKIEEKASRRCGRRSQNNLIFKMEESKQLALSSEV